MKTTIYSKYTPNLLMQLYYIFEENCKNEKLSGLTMITIENEYLEKFKYDDLIEEFISKNARTSCFL